jgi:hypothetical protein
MISEKKKKKKIWKAPWVAYWYLNGKLEIGFSENKKCRNKAVGPNAGDEWHWLEVRRRKDIVVLVKE